METLVYKRKAIKSKDGSIGYLYVHSWGTGYQELIFPSKEAADNFIKRKNEIFSLTSKQRKIYWAIMQEYRGTDHESALKLAIKEAYFKSIFK